MLDLGEGGVGFYNNGWVDTEITVLHILATYGWVGARPSHYSKVPKQMNVNGGHVGEITWE